MILSNKCSINQSVGIIKKRESFALPPFLIYKVLLLHLRHHLTHLAACDHLHHLARLVELFQQTVNFLNSGTATLGNTCTTCSVQNLGMYTILRSHEIE